MWWMPRLATCPARRRLDHQVAAAPEAQEDDGDDGDEVDLHSRARETNHSLSQSVIPEWTVWTSL